MQLQLWILGLVSVVLVNGCLREPEQGYARSGKLRGDGGYKIQFSEPVTGYVPGKPYTCKPRL